MKWFKILGVNLIILIIGVVALEMAFGNWFSPNRLNRLNVLRNIVFELDIRGTYSAPFERVVYKRDQYGFRGKYDDVSKIDVLTIGGSTTDQRLLTEGQTWHDVAAQKFLRRNKKVSVVNAGIGGQSTYGHIKNFKWWFPNIANLKAKYYLFYVGINDFYKKPGNYFDDLNPKRSRIFGIVKDRSALYTLYRTIRGHYLADVNYKLTHRKIDFEKFEWTEKALHENHEELMKEALAEYKHRLGVLASEVNKLGSKAIFVSQPVIRCKRINGKVIGTVDTEDYFGTTINGVDYCLMMDILNQTTMAEGEKLGVITFDLAREVGFNQSDFYDYVHITPSGAEKIGSYLYNKLDKLSIESASFVALEK